MKVSKVLAIIQLSMMYLSLIFLFVGSVSLNGDDNLTAAFFISGFALAIISSVIAFTICIFSFVSIFKRNTNDYTKFVMIYKIVAVPWFVGNFVFLRFINRWNA